MNNNIEVLFPIIRLNLETKKATLNEKAQKEFKDELEKIQDFLKRLDLNKKAEFIYLKNNLYFINIKKGIKYTYLFFSEIDDESTLLNLLKSKEGRDIEVYPKEILKEFLFKFIALKKRYGGFNLKFLYLKIEFTQSLKYEIQQNYIHRIIDNSLKIIRTSDVVGQISENSFGLILTNSSSEGVNIIIEKIINLINDINVENQKKILEIYAVVASEIFIFKNSNFNVFIDELDSKSRPIRVGDDLSFIFK